MATVRIKRLTLTDFKGVRNGEYVFSNNTKISAANGLGKTTIATAWYWLTMDKDYDLKSNPNVRPNGMEECIPRVDLVLDIDGKEITVTKSQKTLKSKPDSKGIVKITSSNTYEINSVPKTERDFRDYLEDEGINWDLFLALSHPNVFTGQKSSDMRKILFKMASEKSDLDIANMKSDTIDIAALLSQGYKLEEIEAMHKASKKKAEAQVRDIPNQIIGMEKSKVDYDTAELELQKSVIEEQIAEKENMLSDAESTLSKHQELTDKIMELKFQMNSIQQQAQDKLNNERRSIQNKIDIAEKDFHTAVQRHNMIELDIKRLGDYIKRRDQERAELGKEYNRNVNKKFDDSKWTFPKDSTLCPTCGRAYDSQKIQELRSDFEIRKKQAAEDFDKRRQDTLDDLISRGNDLKRESAEKAKELDAKKAELEQIKADKIRFNKEQTEETKKLSELPERIDLSGNQEYEMLENQAARLEEILSSMNDGATYRSSLKNELDSLRHDLSEVEKQIAVAGRNLEIDEQIADLQKKQREYEQAKADSEKILDQLDTLSKRKNELLVDEINQHFEVVKWILFDYQKNGNYKETCIPAVLSDAGELTKWEDMNGGLKVKVRLDICYSLQKFFGMYYPVFLDEAAEVNDWNIPRNDNTQLIALNVTTDKELKVEGM
ncbi:chromosome segregation protein [[Eubacterium] contortum]|uniref:Chromosome segregation protein n=1 Tax=Faecalicatena contorta TaxID=39482 RepID=A0A174JMG0_9FIRM|nr:hypothetical protein [Faecalicatena contorta]CUO98355.1 chromosome segregation protein [[Eubacterium] contortum] [Faecalicatena contorta]